MLSYSDQVALILAAGPADAQALGARLGVSQPTLSRVLSGMSARLVRIRSGRSISYALRDTTRGFEDIPVYKIDPDGRVVTLGTLVPVRDAGYVMVQTDGVTLHSEGLPWWVLDMRPQGFMGRAYAAQHAANLGLPASIQEWSDSHAIRALLAQGHDATGNLLLGNLARERFLESPARAPIALGDRAPLYTELSRSAVANDLTWSSAGGEQPKFTAYAETPWGVGHVIVKFTLPQDNAITQRWRDLLLCEHHALEALASAGFPASQTSVVDGGGDGNKQRFLEVLRFDRVGERGRRGLSSLSAVDNEFAGLAMRAWPEVTAKLAADKHITDAAHRHTCLLYAYGCLIGNTDMHHGNLAFINTHGRPYELAPAFDMLPMAFQPRTGGQIVDTIAPTTLNAAVPPLAWRNALVIARDFLQRVQGDARLSSEFSPCLQALRAHLDVMAQKIGLLA